ncbi:MAG: beta-lactamase family protein [Roseivirga sp.]|jgi:CubicO group peptidase (beta-lactamase class C family)|uniref:serine hydrolase domain-containing protein n=1 Tax=Roseivirga sp. TaxID=1964215 RepID=UPI001B0AC28A|nr:serine hydrolase domain-containing protein [Roseivirga sp.]MBO6496350.1 beta-lactamase family protein [Roseivirga sp.]
MKLNLLSILLLLLIVSCQPSKESSEVNWLSNASPSEQGFSSTFETELDNYIQTAINDTIIPGGTFLIARNGRIVYHKSYGEIAGTSIKNEGIYRIASMTKAITSVSIMQLVEQGKINLDDPVYEYIPAFKNQVVLDQFNPSDSTYTTLPVDKPVTIRNLMTHTSGIVYGSFNPGKIMAVYDQFDMNVGFTHPTWSTEEWINRLAEVPLAHQPGARFSYGLNMDVMGRIIEVVSGQKLNTYFKEHIFDVVGMEDTYFYLPESKHDRLVPLAQKINGTFMSTDQLGMSALTDYPKQGPRDFFAGGAGLSSTALDYARFIQTLVEGGGELLGSEAMAEMTKDQLPLVINDYKNYPKGPDGSFALGFQLYQDKPTKKSPKSPGTYEWSGYFNTKFFIDPQQNMIFVGMTQVNAFQGGAFWEGMYKLIYQSID